MSRRSSDDRIKFTQPLHPLLTSDEVELVCSALGLALGGREFECVLGRASFSGSSALVRRKASLRAYAPDTTYPLSIPRRVGMLTFSSALSVFSFLLLHEAAHFIITGEGNAIEQACDVVALAMQADFSLPRPTVLTEAPKVAATSCRAA